LNALFSLKFEAEKSIEIPAITYQYIQCRILEEMDLHLPNSYSFSHTKLIIAIHRYDAVRINVMAADM
jgi:hypothetical protein